MSSFTIEHLALLLANRIKRADPNSDASIEVMAYALGYKLTNILIITGTLFIGALTHEFVDALIGLVAFCLMRYETGGFHFNSLTLCTFASILLLSIIPHVDINKITVLILNSLSIILIFALSKYLKLFRLVIPVTLVAMNFLFQSEVLALAFLAQVLLTIPWRNGGEGRNGKANICA